MAETMTQDMDLSEILGGLSPVVERDTFGEGAAAFEVELRRVDKGQLEALYKKSVRTVKDRRGNSTTENDVDKFRAGLRDLVLIGWRDLTVAKVAMATGKDASSLNGKSNVDVPFTPKNAMTMLALARGLVDGQATSFEDFVFERATKLSDQLAAEDRASKNG